MNKSGRKFVDVSRTHPRYFEDEAGKTWVPVGCNICVVRGEGDGGTSIAHWRVRAEFDRWLRFCLRSSVSPC